MGDVDVGAAQRPGCDADDDLPFARAGLGYVEQGQVAGSGLSLDERSQSRLLAAADAGTAAAADLVRAISLYSRVVAVTAFSVGVRSALDPAA